MPVGAEAYGTGGRIFAETSYAGNFFGYFTTNGQQTGTYVDARLINRRLIAFAPQSAGSYGGPDLTLDASTGTISWNYDISVSGVRPASPSETILFGGY